LWVNGRRAIDEEGRRLDCGKPGRLLREFTA